MLQRVLLLSILGLTICATLGSLAPAALSVGADQRYRGFVRPAREVELAAPFEDLLLGVDVEESEAVTQGQVIARMDNRLQSAVVEAAQLRADNVGEMERARYDEQQALLVLEMIENAAAQNATSQYEVRRAQISLRQVQAARTTTIENQKLAVVNLKLEEARLERYLIRAPFDGIVVRRLAEVGSMLRDNDKVIMLADLSTLEAQLNLPSEIYGELRVGTTYTLRAEAPVGRMLDARLKSVSPVIDTASGTVRCVFAIENADLKLPAGFTVYLER